MRSNTQGTISFAFCRTCSNFERQLKVAKDQHKELCSNLHSRSLHNSPHHPLSRRHHLHHSTLEPRKSYVLIFRASTNLLSTFIAQYATHKSHTSTHRRSCTHAPCPPEKLFAVYFCFRGGCHAWRCLRLCWGGGGAEAAWTACPTG